MERRLHTTSKLGPARLLVSCWLQLLVAHPALGILAEIAQSSHAHYTMLVTPPCMLFGKNTYTFNATGLWTTGYSNLLFWEIGSWRSK